MLYQGPPNKSEVTGGSHGVSEGSGIDFAKSKL